MSKIVLKGWASHSAGNALKSGATGVATQTQIDVPGLATSGRACGVVHT
ncbi:MAG: hypothetical protein AABY83_10625 [Pseudomonadota bacterium]